ncbi:MAG: dehydrogenase, partial [Rhizobacter sp.]|nr:dehydrogenase [Rhizobacter sp.]
YGQGKWYPGEMLPRWSLNLFWRTDREPVWMHPELWADEHREYGATAEHAKTLLQGVAQRMGLNAKFVFAAYEDVWYYLYREQQLPANVDPFDSKLSEPMERARLAKVFSQGLGEVVGHVLPIARHHSGRPGAPRWQSGPWFLRGERAQLVPGDSALGYRLPLNSQPWAGAEDYPYVNPPDPTEEVGRLPSYAELRPKFGAIALGADGESPAPDASSATRRPKSFESAGWVTRTAMSAEPRNGRLYVFMPPTETLPDYLELVAAVEETAYAMQLPVVLEGYEPPRDPRLTNLRVTPDPGVIEVNVQPVENWGDLVEQTTFLYQSAAETRLSTEKFMLDGRHTGTGGGNHFVLGGATPADSPFLRRPDLLASMVAYWHNHPSLSYLFSGLFVGPTSQAPRVDEARNDSVYELEIAFGEMKRITESGQTSPPWLIDRILRNLLIDVTGNTHRAEFCIDKLYSPDGPTGRLGLLEMRAFEMPPHARMSLTQQLLMRALIARFWETPYAPTRLARWGTELHDRFVLPHFVWSDLSDVIDDLNQAGYPVQLDWFAPHLNFRFPRLGDFSAEGVNVELRLALEPWHVMGEEGAAAGSVRFVDSSVERVQVKVSGLVGERHVLTCNGRKVPLQPTGTLGEYVGAVRFRAWRSGAALHPMIDPHAPLTFDLLDTWMSRSVGGCQYHVAHPGGRNYTTFPINALEAEARRLARFFRTGHTPGDMKVPADERNPDFPFTLDLRRTPPPGA